MAKLTKAQANLEAEGWVFEFEAPVGERLMKRFHSVTTFDPLASIWWCRSEDLWVRHGEHHGRSISSHSRRVHSFKSFLRHLKRHPILSEADKVILDSQFLGYSVCAYPPGRAVLGKSVGELPLEQTKGEAAHLGSEKCAAFIDVALISQESGHG